MSKKVLITGATGLIGKEALSFLKNDGFEIYATTMETMSDNSVNWSVCNLFDENSVTKLFKDIKPEYLLNFAWITGGDYLTNEKNLLFKDAGFKMLKLFKENGGKRAVYAGTCFEYEITPEIITEETKISPKTLYAQCKNELNQLCTKYAKENDLSFGWGRIFYVFGHNENPTRITAQILNCMKENKIFELGAPNNYLDYMYSKDIANAFVHLLKSNYNGNVNICTGKGILLKDYALLIQKLCGKENLIKYDNNIKPNVSCVGNPKLLNEIIGFTPKYTTESALKKIVKSKFP